MYCSQFAEIKQYVDNVEKLKTSLENDDNFKEIENIKNLINNLNKDAEPNKLLSKNNNNILDEDSFITVLLEHFNTTILLSDEFNYDIFDYDKNSNKQIEFWEKMLKYISVVKNKIYSKEIQSEDDFNNFV